MLGELLDGARVVSAQHGKVAIDRDTWRRLLGDRVARRTEPGALSGGVLTIYVASAPWAQELSLLVNELLERLKPLNLRIASLRFRVRQQIQGSPGGRLKPRQAQRKISRSSPSIRWSTKRSVGEKLDAAAFSFSKYARKPEIATPLILRSTTYI